MFDIVRLVETALGTSLSNEQAQRLRHTEAQQYGGEVHYHPKLTKPTTPAKALIIEAGTTAPAFDVAQRLGISVRYVRKVRQLSR
jgi:hypothetical protein